MSAAPRDLLLIDFSSLAVPIWMMSGSEPDPNWASTQMVAKIRALASGQAHVVIACDSRGKNFRHDIEPTYKAQRETQPEAMYHQMALAKETLRGDGFLLVAVPGYEADDILASFTTAALALDGVSVLVASSDKDILQLVGPRVHVKSLRDGAVLDADGVKAKFGVPPESICDYLCLVGDSSDNVRGCKGIGPKRAAELLAKHGTLAAIMATGGEGMTPAVRDALVEFASRCDVVRSLIALRTDVPVKIEEAFAPRVAQEAEMDDIDATMQTLTSEAPQSAPTGGVGAPESRVEGRAVETSAATTQRPDVSREVSRQIEQAALVPQVMPAPAPAPAEWAFQLEPRSLAEAKHLSDILFASKLFSAYGTPQAILSTVMYARELNIPSISGLRLIHNIEGKHALSADLMVGLCLKSKACEYFTPVEITDTKATFKTKRTGADEFAYSYTIEMAQRAGFIRKGSNWEKAPQDQLVARCKSKLARLIYPDFTGGLYTPDELRDQDYGETAA